LSINFCNISKPNCMIRFIINYFCIFKNNLSNSTTWSPFIFISSPSSSSPLLESYLFLLLPQQQKHILFLLHSTKDFVICPRINIFIDWYTSFFQVINNFLLFVSQRLQVTILLWNITNFRNGIRIKCEVNIQTTKTCTVLLWNMHTKTCSHHKTPSR